MRNAIQDNPEKKNFNLCSASFFNLSVIKSLACKTPLLTTLVLLGCLSYSYTYYVIYIYKKKKNKKTKRVKRFFLIFIVNLRNVISTSCKQEMLLHSLRLFSSYTQKRKLLYVTGKDT